MSDLRVGDLSKNPKTTLLRFVISSYATVLKNMDIVESKRFKHKSQMTNIDILGVGESVWDEMNVPQLWKSFGCLDAAESVELENLLQSIGFVVRRLPTGMSKTVNFEVQRPDSLQACDERLIALIISFEKTSSAQSVSALSAARILRDSVPSDDKSLEALKKELVRYIGNRS